MANMYYYRGRKEKPSKWTLVKQSLPFVWLLMFGLFCFFAPFLIDSISFFKAKAVNVYGDQTIPSNIVAQIVGTYKRNWLFINASGIKDKLEKATGNAVASVAVKKRFKWYIKPKCGGRCLYKRKKTHSGSGKSKQKLSHRRQRQYL